MEVAMETEIGRGMGMGIEIEIRVSEHDACRAAAVVARHT